MMLSIIFSFQIVQGKISSLFLIILYYISYIVLLAAESFRDVSEYISSILI